MNNINGLSMDLGEYFSVYRVSRRDIIGGVIAIKL